jgi:hypothetical protein
MHLVDWGEFENFFFVYPFFHWGNLNHPAPIRLGVAATLKATSAPKGGWLWLAISNNDLATHGLATKILPIDPAGAASVHDYWRRFLAPIISDGFLMTDLRPNRIWPQPNTCPTTCPTMSNPFHNEPNSDAQRRLAEKQPSLSKANRVYFKFLGLKTAESNEQAILDAARKMAKLVHERAPFNAPELIDRSRQEIALATYRLLDPRRRKSPRERIQLTRPIDREDRQYQTPDPGSLLRSMEQGAEDHFETILNPLIDRALGQTAGNALTVDSKSDSRNWLEERREIVRVVQTDSTHSSGANLRWDKYGFSWLRSVFGL